MFVSVAFVYFHDSKTDRKLCPASLPLSSIRGDYCTTNHILLAQENIKIQSTVSTEFVLLLHRHKVEKF